MLLIGSRHRRHSCSEAYRFARSGSVPANPKVYLDVPDSSLGVHRAPLRRHDGRCVHFPPGPSPRLRLGTATSRACSALAVPPGFSGFLRSRVDPKAHSFDCPRVCCTPQPAMGFTTFRTPCPVSRPSATRGSWTSRSIRESSPVANTLRSVPLSGSVRPCRHRAESFRTGRVHRLVCLPAVSSLARVRVATVRGPCSSTSRRCSAGESVAMRATLPRCARSMLPWALDRPVPMLPRSRAAQRVRWTFRLADRTASASPDPNVGGRQGVSALSGSCDP